jgi:hypothetical protein
MNVDAFVDEYVGLWCEAVQHAYKLAKTEKLRQFRGEPVRTLDSRMMHPFSELIGAARMCERLVPPLVWLELDPLTLLKGAYDDARAEFAREEAERLGYELK